MSDFVLRNGRGDGSRARVSSDGRLYTESRSTPLVASSADDGDQYLFPVGKRSIATVDTEYALLYINPTGITRQFYVQRFVITVLNTTPVLFRLYLGSTAPSANNVSFSPGNTNTSSVKQGNFDADVWNTVGTGMTVASKGTESFAGYFAQGLTDVPIEGGQVWGLNAAVLITAECSVANFVTAILTGWEGDV